MKIKPFAIIMICLMTVMLLTSCGKATEASDSTLKDKLENVSEYAEGEEAKNDRAVEEEPEIKEEKDEEEGFVAGKSLAQRMAGKYSFHYSDEDGNDEFYILDVVPFGDNLYAFCGQAMNEDSESLAAYTFWASEFIPYDADEMTSTDGDNVTVNELNFSVMSNAGKYWNAGHKGTITLTDEGLLFEGFNHEGFLVPDNDDSRLFLKDDRVEEAFCYLRDGIGDDELEGLWILDRKGADLYLEFAGANMYIYSKDPGSEVFYAAGGCDFSDRTLSCTVSTLGQGGMPLALSCDYEVSGDNLTLRILSPDLQEEMNGKYKKVRDGKVHVTTMDEVELTAGSFGMFGDGQHYEELTLQDYYGVFVSSAKSLEGCTPTINRLEEAGIIESFTVYTPDFDHLNPEPYYVVTTGLYISENEAEEALSEVKAAGFKDAYAKYAGSYTGDRFWYTMHDSEKIDVLKDGVMLRGVSLTIPYRTDGEPVTAYLLVTEDTVFDRSTDLESFGNYKKGDTPYEWIIRNNNLMNDNPDRYQMYGEALSGVFEVGLDDNKITAYYGSYWWD